MTSLSSDERRVGDQVNDQKYIDTNVKELMEQYHNIIKIIVKIENIM